MTSRLMLCLELDVAALRAGLAEAERAIADFERNRMARPYSSPGTKVLLSILVGAAVEKPAGWMNRKYVWGPSRSRGGKKKKAR